MAAPHTEAPAEEHSSFIKTPQQLVVVIVLAFVIPIAIILLLAKLVTTGGDKYDETHPAMTDEAVAARIKPVGQVSLGDASGPKAVKSGEEIYKQVCAACHATGVLNAPKLGDKLAWAKLIGEGIEILLADSIKGIRQMPPRGGNPDLSDFDMRRAITYMANQAGANWKEPEAPAPEPAAAAAGDKVAAAEPMSGKAVYDSACVACHATGVAGAPKTGDKALWAPRIQQGMDALYTASIKGKGAMPPKGGQTQLSDANVKAAVDYLVGLAK